MSEPGAPPAADPGAGAALRRAAGVTQVEVDGRSCLFSTGAQHVQFLNDTASDVWWLADGTRSADDVSAALATSYGAPLEQVRRDVSALVAELRAAGFLEP